MVTLTLQRAYIALNWCGKIYERFSFLHLKQYFGWTRTSTVTEDYKLKTWQCLKGHSQLKDRADLDTSFLTLKKVHPNLESKFI